MYNLIFLGSLSYIIVPKYCHVGASLPENGYIFCHLGIGLGLGLGFALGVGLGLGLGLGFGFYVTNSNRKVRIRGGVRVLCDKFRS